MSDDNTNDFGIAGGRVYEVALVRMLMREQGHQDVTTEDVHGWFAGTEKPALRHRTAYERILASLESHVELARVRLARSPELHAAIAEAILVSDAADKGKRTGRRSTALGIKAWLVRVYLPSNTQSFLRRFMRVSRWKQEELLGFLLERFCLEIEERTRTDRANAAAAELKAGNKAMEKVLSAKKAERAARRLVAATDAAATATERLNTTYDPAE